jgi:hypothetical protein
VISLGVDPESAADLEYFGGDDLPTLASNQNHASCDESIQALESFIVIALS